MRTRRKNADNGGFGDPGVTATPPTLPPAWHFCPNLRAGSNLLPPNEARHALSSRRMRPGDRLTLFDGGGHLGEGVIAAASNEPGPQRAGGPARGQRPTGGLEVLVHELISVPRPAGAFHLLMAGAKGDRLDWAVEKCTELGATSIHLVNFARSVVRVGPAHIARLSRTAIEACKQCHRAWLPAIAAHQSLPEALDSVQPATVLVADPDQTNTALGQWLAPGRQSSALGLVVGPEGGVTTAELDHLRHRGAVPVRLAAYILRVETAAVAASATWAACQDG